MRVVGEEEVRGVRGMETAYWAQWSQSRDHRLRQYCIQKGRREVSAYILGTNTHLHETPLYSTRAVRMVRALAPKAACRSEETLIDLGEGCVATVQNGRGIGSITQEARDPSWGERTVMESPSAATTLTADGAS